jgi:hypothetical protein
MTALEDRLYMALLGARTIVAAANAVNPQAWKILNLVDSAAAAYKEEQGKASAVALTHGETADAAGE